MADTQNYQNHVRWYPLQHFVITPILLLNLIWQIVRFYQTLDQDHAESLLIAFVLILIALAARLQALKVQDRLIRLEEKIRYKELLPPELLSKALNLSNSQVFALRFTSDKELPELVERTLNGEFKNSNEIKLAVKNWRGDYMRA